MIELKTIADKYGMPYDKAGKVDMTKTVQLAIDIAADKERIRALEAERDTAVREMSTWARRCGQLEAQLESIRQYGLDTLSGRVDGPDDRKWYRDGVNEMSKRARPITAPETKVDS